MPDLNRPSLESAFHSLQQKMVQLLEYATVVTPCVKEEIRLLPELSDSVVVLVVSRLEAFFKDLVSLGTRELTVRCTSLAIKMLATERATSERRKRFKNEILFCGLHRFECTHSG
jgi:hypothetical protein